MLLKPWEKLPPVMQNEKVRPYYDSLMKKKFTLVIKRLLDIIISGLLIIILFPIMLISFFVVALGSPGPVFYRQDRVGAYGNDIYIYKFRTMVTNADKIGAQITIGDDDPRITRVGKILRTTHLDELPQLFSVMAGKMTLVGTRPEVRKYVDCYSEEMMATLLLPPGSVSDASLAYRRENAMLEGVEDPEEYYINTILTDKMVMNLKYTRSLTVGGDLIVMLKTIGCIFRK